MRRGPCRATSTTSSTRRRSCCSGGENPFPAHDTPIARRELVWPPVAAYLVSPLTVLPAGVADVVMVGIGLVCFALALWLVGVRDWRVYGVVALWPEFVGEMRVSHLTPVIALLLAAAWRWRDARGAPGVLDRARRRGQVLRVAGRRMARSDPRRHTRRSLAAGSRRRRSSSSCPSRRSIDYAHAADPARARLRPGQLQRVRPPRPGGCERDRRPRGDAGAVGVVLLAAIWRYQSFALAIGAALVISPIVWLDYYALAALPLAIARPRLSAIWFLPLATWGLEGAGIGIGDASSTVRLLLVFGRRPRGRLQRRATGRARGRRTGA